MKLPQLSLRELFLLTTIVALSVGWWLDNRKLTDVIDRLTPKFQVVEGTELSFPPSGPRSDSTPLPPLLPIGPFFQEPLPAAEGSGPLGGRDLRRHSK